MSKQILIETRQFKPNPVTITEVSGDLGGNIMVEGVLATVEVKNGNGRYYKKDLWEREIDNFQKKINQKSNMKRDDDPDLEFPDRLERFLEASRSLRSFQNPPEASRRVQKPPRSPPAPRLKQALRP